MLRSIFATNFRCYKEVAWKDIGQRNVILGVNGAGKTSLLEAIYFLARCRSFRTSQTREMRLWNTKSLGVAGKVDHPESTENEQHLKVEWTPTKRKFSIDQQESLSFRDYWGSLLAVVFSNDDRFLVRGASTARRQWMDALIATLYPTYLPLVQRANNLLREKNALLHMEAPDRKVWESITDTLFTTADEIQKHRIEMTEKLRPLMTRFYTEVSGAREKMEFQFDDRYVRQSARSRDSLWAEELKGKLSVAGHHRDDWDLKLKGKSVRHFGSEGQQRSVAIVMRLAEMTLIHENAGKHPLILIDDALNELDSDRRERFFRELPEEAQVIVTTTREENVLGLKEAHHWEVEDGNINLVKSPSTAGIISPIDRPPPMIPPDAF